MNTRTPDSHERVMVRHRTEVPVPLPRGTAFACALGELVRDLLPGAGSRGRRTVPLEEVSTELGDTVRVLKLDYDQAEQARGTYAIEAVLTLVAVVGRVPCAVCRVPCARILGGLEKVELLAQRRPLLSARAIQPSGRPSAGPDARPSGRAGHAATPPHL
ncbi:hypothetical protein ACFZBZ_33575 [Streptomyces sp. NPDC008196]|uniref:hypothetical protein n=1 Tax=Streptomyces sp. NPDC008196 TaxID=3364819 RepID=UPI0036F16F95